MIREVEPPTPSSRISTSEALPSHRRDPSDRARAAVSRFVRGDLDWIVMKALAKERQRRYESAIGLADDVERFTNHEPVSRRPADGRLSAAEVRAAEPAAGRGGGAGAAGAGRRHRGDDAGPVRGAPAGEEPSKAMAESRSRRRRPGRAEADAAAPGREAADAR